MNALRLRWIVAIIACTLVASAPVAARTTSDGLSTVVLSSLPKEARSLYVLIHAGGPFAYERDGVVFGNREHLLPAKPRGYYHEYTVTTPNAANRGARRIVCGGAARAPEACYYSDDHYKTFRRIRE